MLSHLLVATDASEASDEMLKCVKTLAHVGTRRVTLVHVFDVRDVGGLYGQLQALLLPKLESQQRALQAAGFEVDIEIPLGTPFIEINRLAKERECSAIVVASLGETMVREMLLGSVAYSVIQNAVIPVFLVRIEILAAKDGLARCQAACDDPFQHVLFPTDFSDTAERAFQYLEHVSCRDGCAVTLLHVQDRAKIDRHLEHKLDEFNRIDRERLDGMKDRLLKSGCRTVQIEILYGSPTAIILERARSDDFTSIVMGAQGRGFIEEIFLGSVANNVARHAPLPVLFVPAVR